MITLVQIRRERLIRRFVGLSVVAYGVLGAVTAVASMGSL